MPTDSREPDDDPFESVTDYREDDQLVICDKRNPNAWLKSDVTVPLLDAEAERATAEDR